MATPYGDITPLKGIAGLSTAFVKSSLANRRFEFWVYKPSKILSKQKLPVLYLMHGTWSVSSDWIQKGDVPQIAEKMINDGQIPPFCIVFLPDGGFGDSTAYSNWADGSGQYEDCLMEDIIPFVEQKLSVIGTKEARGIAGLSMGAFGAYRFALKNVGIFGAVAGHSGIYDASKVFLGIPEAKGRIFASDSEMEQSSPMILVQKLKRHELPAMRIDCGSEDFLFDESKKFSDRLRSLGLAFEYDELPGGHDWNYWKGNIHRTLQFMGRYFQAHLRR